MSWTGVTAQTKGTTASTESEVGILSGTVTYEAHGHSVSDTKSVKVYQEANVLESTTWNNPVVTCVQFSTPVPQTGGTFSPTRKSSATQSGTLKYTSNATVSSANTAFTWAITSNQTYAKITNSATTTPSLTVSENTVTSPRTFSITTTVTGAGSKTNNGSQSITQERMVRGDEQVGEIAYYKSGSIKFVPYSAWTSSLGTPIGVCVIPSAHTKVWGDGKARYVSVTGVDADGSQIKYNEKIYGGPNGDTSLTNYKKVPTWDNTIGGTVGSNTDGYLSSDEFLKTTNVIDTLTKYSGSTPYIPSPYSGDGYFYADYKRTTGSSGSGNPLSDFNGKSNTSTLVGLGIAYSAANACYKYKTSGTTAGNWYLPAMGELGYLLARLKIINTALSKCGGIQFAGIVLWSSTENGTNYAYVLNLYSGHVGDTLKAYSYYVRPFIALS